MKQQLSLQVVVVSQGIFMRDPHFIPASSIVGISIVIESVVHWGEWIYSNSIVDLI